MQAGRLDQRVTVERVTVEQDPVTGDTSEAWTPLFSAWAGVEPLVGREFIAAQAVQSEITARVRMRYRPGVGTADRVIHEGTVYNIQAVIDVRSGNREMQLMCVAVG